MKCNNCGYENQQNFDYCPNCGTVTQPSEPTQTAEAVSLNPAADKIMCALKDNMFLILCVLITVSCGLSLLSGTLPLIQVLITIFLWLTYADAQKGFANEKHLQFISGAVYAQYIIVNVVSVILIVCGGLLIAMSGVIDGAELAYELFKLEGTGISSDLSDLFSLEMLRYLGTIISIAVTLIGIIALVFNMLMMRKIHRFAKSIYMGIVYQNTNFESPRTVRNWFIFIAVCDGIAAISSILAGALAILTSACTTAIMIIVAILIDKHFVKQNF